MNILFFLRPKVTISFLEDTDSLRQALEKIKKSGYTNLPVLNSDGEFVYSLSEGDILFKILEDDVFSIHHSECIKINDIKRRRTFKTINVNNNIEDLVQIALDQNYVPVLDDRNKFIGIITRHDIIKYFFNNQVKEK